MRITSNAQALSVACPLCGAQPQQPCRYIKDRWEKNNVAGEPTQRPHNTRMQHYQRLTHRP